MNYTYKNYFQNTLTPKEKIDAIKSICKLEEANIKANKLVKTAQNLFGANTINDYINTSGSKLHSILSIMTPENAKVFQDIFLNKVSKYNNTEFVSQSTYYRNRKNAIEEFLYYYINT
ncbi:MG284/MPN403 family protein [Mycoplasmopsis felifaucium]|uniref:Uncharacterized protein n=1 Tax=Mycoplasmopsis felifaucium TaxID=35768 RepID=A0ABZ2RPI2_9BACT